MIRRKSIICKLNEKEKIIIAVWILISVLMPILYLGMRTSEYDKVINTYFEKDEFIPDPIERKPPPIPLKIREQTLIDVFIITVFELVSITGLTIFIISKKDKTDYQKQQIT